MRFAAAAVLFLATAVLPAAAQQAASQEPRPAPAPKTKRRATPARHPPGTRPQPQQHPQAPQPQAHSQGQAHPSAGGRPSVRPRPPVPSQANPSAQGRPPAGGYIAEQARPATPPRRDTRVFPAPPRRDTRVYPAPNANNRVGPAPGTFPRPRPGPRPRPITEPRQFVRKWAPPPAPKPAAGSAVAAAAAAVASRPPSVQQAADMNNPALLNRLSSEQGREIEPNRYYWHQESGVNYAHYYSGGEHWYGFPSGSEFYWTRYQDGRLWSYDPVTGRPLYFNDGAWWWQNPEQPQTTYVYQNNTYVQYAAPPEGESKDVVVGFAWGGAAGTEPEAAPQAPKIHSDVDDPGYSVKVSTDRFALVIGVEDYATLPKADFAARDAAAVRAHLKALGYPDRNVVVLTSSQAARSSVAKYVESWLPERVSAGSRVFVYFSGHGAPDPATGTAYLMPWDGDAKYLSDTGYPLKQLYAKLNALPAREIVVVLDSCFSGAGGRSVLVAGARPLVTKIDAGRSEAGRAVVFTASGPDEITGSLPDQGHGLFTYYFLKALNGEAEATADGVTVQALFDDLSPNVQDAARRDNRDQTPQLIVPPDGSRKLLVKDLR